MPEHTFSVDTPVTVRTMTEAQVAVPEACFEQCKKLVDVLGQAALDQLDGKLDAIVCDTEDQRYTFPRHCPAVSAHVRLVGSTGPNPGIMGEGNSGSWISRVDAAIEKNGSQRLFQAKRMLKFK